VGFLFRFRDCIEMLLKTAAHITTCHATSRTFQPTCTLNTSVHLLVSNFGNKRSENVLLPCTRATTQRQTSQLVSTHTRSHSLSLTLPHSVLVRFFFFSELKKFRSKHCVVQSLAIQCHRPNTSCWSCHSDRKFRTHFDQQIPTLQVLFLLTHCIPTNPMAPHTTTGIWTVIGPAPSISPSFTAVAAAAQLLVPDANV